MLYQTLHKVVYMQAYTGDEGKELVAVLESPLACTGLACKQGRHFWVNYTADHAGHLT